MNHFDSQRRKVKRDFYEWPFKVVRRILVDKQQTLCEFFYNPEGDTKLEKYFSYKDGKPEVKLLLTMLTNNISLIMKRN